MWGCCEGLLWGDSNAQNFDLILPRKVQCQVPPATTDVENFHPRLEFELFSQQYFFVMLGLVESCDTAVKIRTAVYLGLSQHGGINSVVMLAANDFCTPPALRVLVQ